MECHDPHSAATVKFWFDNKYISFLALYMRIYELKKNCLFSSDFQGRRASATLTNSAQGNPFRTLPKGKPRSRPSLREESVANILDSEPPVRSDGRPQAQLPTATVGGPSVVTIRGGFRGGNVGGMGRGVMNNASTGTGGGTGGLMNGNMGMNTIGMGSMGIGNTGIGNNMGMGSIGVGAGMNLGGGLGGGGNFIGGGGRGGFQGGRGMVPQGPRGGLSGRGGMIGGGGGGGMGTTISCLLISFLAHFFPKSTQNHTFLHPLVAPIALWIFRCCYSCLHPSPLISLRYVLGTC